MNLKQIALDIGSALSLVYPGKSKYKGFHNDPTEQTELAPASLSIEETTALEQDITFGQRLSGEEIRRSKVLTNICQLAWHMLKPSFKGASSMFTVHLVNRWHIGIRIYKPYLLRKDEHGVINEVTPKLKPFDEVM